MSLSTTSSCLLIPPGMVTSSLPCAACSGKTWRYFLILYFYKEHRKEDIGHLWLTGTPLGFQTSEVAFSRQGPLHFSGMYYNERAKNYEVLILWDLQACTWLLQSAHTTAVGTGLSEDALSLVQLSEKKVTDVTAPAGSLSSSPFHPPNKQSWTEGGRIRPQTVNSTTVFLVFPFKQLDNHSAIGEALKRLMYVLYTGNYICFYS